MPKNKSTPESFPTPEKTSPLTSHEQELIQIHKDTVRDLASFRAEWVKTPIEKVKKPYEPISKAERIFLRKFGTLMWDLSTIYDIPLKQRLALIEREASFKTNKKADETSGSFWYGRLSDEPLEDMKFTTPKGRWGKYVDLFAQIDASILSAIKDPKVRTTVTKLLSLIDENGKVVKKTEYDQIIQDLAKLSRKDNHLNLIMSTIVQSQNEREVEEDIAKKGKGMKKLCLQQLEAMKKNPDGLFRLVFQGSVQKWETKKRIMELLELIITQIKTSEKSKEMRDFFTLAKYNGSPDKFHYATAIMIRERMRSDGSIARFLQK